MERINRFCNSFLVKDELPMYSVQKDGFRQMLKIFDSRYEIPDQSYFSRTAVPELYAITRRRVAEQVAAVRYFAGTTDLWSSIDLKPFISYTIQYVTDNLELECLSLCTSYLPQDHTGEIIFDMLEATLEEWSLKSLQQVVLPLIMQLTLN